MCALSVGPGPYFGSVLSPNRALVPWLGPNLGQKSVFRIFCKRFPLDSHEISFYWDYFSKCVEHGPPGTIFWGPFHAWNGRGFRLSNHINTVSNSTRIVLVDQESSGVSLSRLFLWRRQQSKCPRMSCNLHRCEEVTTKPNSNRFISLTAESIVSTISANVAHGVVFRCVECRICEFEHNCATLKAKLKVWIAVAPAIQG